MLKFIFEFLFKAACLLGFGLGLVSIPLLQADEAVRTDAERSTFESSRDLKGYNSQILPDYLRDNEGKVLRIHFDDAYRACIRRGKRLPSIHELAVYAQSLGAIGVSNKPRPGDELIGGGTREHFYYNRSGYQRPSGEIGFYPIWSATTSGIYIYYLSTLTGRISTQLGTYIYGGRGGIAGVICIN